MRESTGSSAQDRFHLQLRNEPERTIEVDAVVYAAAPTHLEHIIGRRHELNATYEALARFEHEPIYTVYLKYAPAVARCARLHRAAR